MTSSDEKKDRSPDPIFKELKGAALVRELHVYGRQKTLRRSEGLDSNTQHLGFGRQLMCKAEELARESGYSKIAVIAAIGTREYYRKLGYQLEGTYMMKNF
jgi:elongator complex protein 3